MSDLTEMQAAALEVLQDLGTTCTLQSVVGVYANGAVTETVTEYTATCSDLLDESQRYVTMDTAQRADGTFYLAASDLAATPKVGDRVVYLTRNFAVLAVMPHRVEGGVAAWRLDVAELGEA